MEKIILENKLLEKWVNDSNKSDRTRNILLWIFLPPLYYLMGCIYITIGMAIYYVLIK